MQSIAAVSVLRARPRDTPMSHCAVAVPQPRGMETHTPQRTKETSSLRFPERGHIITPTRHTLVAAYVHCLHGLLELSQTPGRGQ